MPKIGIIQTALLENFLDEKRSHFMRNLSM